MIVIDIAYMAIVATVFGYLAYVVADAVTRSD